MSDLTSGTPPASFSLTTPTTDEVFFKDNDIVILGVCDPNGGLVQLSGDLFSTPVSTACDSNGEYTYTTLIPADLVSNRDPFDIVAEQEDFEGNVLDDDATNLRVHCTDIPTSELLTCTSGGSGNSVSDPYLVGDIYCLQEMRDGVMCNYALTNDIDANVTRTWNGGQGFEPVPANPTNDPGEKFEGTLEGNGHTITGLVIRQRYTSGTGIFSKLHSSFPSTLPAFARNLNLVNAVLGGERKMGFIAGELSNAEAENITITDSLVTSVHDGEITYIGGIAGHMENSIADGIHIENLSMQFSSTSSHPMHVATHLGGVAGSMGNSRIQNSNIYVNIGQNSAPNNAGLRYQNIGGIAGWSHSSRFLNINSNSTIHLSSELGAAANPSVPSLTNIGGVLGQALNSYDVNEICNNTSLILSSDNGASKIGGFGGDVAGAAINKIHNTGTINLTSDITETLTDVGGLLGSMSNSQTMNVLSDINTNFTSGYVLNAGGYIGNLLSASAGVDLYAIANLASFDAQSLSPSATETSQGGLIGRYTSNPSSSHITVSTSGINPSFNPIGVADPSGSVTYEAFTYAQLEVRNSNDFGFDFTNTWARNPTPSIPYLQACP